MQSGSGRLTRRPVFCVPSAIVERSLGKGLVVSAARSKRGWTADNSVRSSNGSRYNLRVSGRRPRRVRQWNEPNSNDSRTEGNHMFANQDVRQVMEDSPDIMV